MSDRLIDETARVLRSILGKNASIREFCTVHDSVIGDNVLILERVSIKKSIVGRGSDINANTYIENAEIGEDVQIAMNCSIPGVTHNFSKKGINHEDVFKKIIIKDGAWIAAGCIILPGVTIGEGSVVGAGAIVNEDVPDHCIYTGTRDNPRLRPIN